MLFSLCTECMFTAYGYPVTYHGDQSDMPCWTLYFHGQNQLTNTSELFSVLPVTWSEHDPDRRYSFDENWEISKREFYVHGCCSPSTLNGYFSVSTNPCLPGGTGQHEHTGRLLAVLVKRLCWGYVLGHARLSQSTLTLRYCPVPFLCGFWQENRF